MTAPCPRADGRASTVGYSRHPSRRIPSDAGPGIPPSRRLPSTRRSRATRSSGSPKGYGTDRCLTSGDYRQWPNCSSEDCRDNIRPSTAETNRFFGRFSLGEDVQMACSKQSSGAVHGPIEWHLHDLRMAMEMGFCRNVSAAIDYWGATLATGRSASKSASKAGLVPPDYVMPQASRTSIIALFAGSTARSSSSSLPATGSAQGTIS